MQLHEPPAEEASAAPSPATHARTRRATLLGALAVALVAVGLALAIRPGSQGSDLAEFLGRFHILALHVPIGVLLLVVSAEALALSPKLRPRLDPAIGLSLAFLALTGVAAFGLGLLLAHGGGYPPKLIAMHRGFTLGGIVTSAIAYAIWSLRAPGSGRLGYRIALAATVGLFTAGAHAGGSLTHGEDFLTRYAPSFVKRLMGVADTAKPEQPSGAQAGSGGEPRIYSDVIAPALKAKCVECHGPDKAKGGLRLDSMAAILKGGEHGPSVKPGKPDASPLLARMLLPVANDDHMPPDNKAGLDPAELDLVKWWIDRGATEELRVRDTLPPDSVRALLARTGGGAAAFSAGGSAPAPATSGAPSASASAATPSASASSASAASLASPSATPPAAGARTAYGAIVAPILAARCAGCHGAAKAKGKLRVDSIAGLVAGGKEGPAIVARDPSRGTLFGRARLPGADDKHMPPPEEPQLAALELEAITWWVANGADATTTLEAMPAKLQALRPPAARPAPKSSPATGTSSALTSASSGTSASPSNPSGTGTPTVANGTSALAPLDATSPRYAGAPRDVRLYADVVAPVLDRKCGKCHTGKFASGGVSIDDVEAMRAHGALVFGDEAKSPLITRMLLPEGDSDRMPPKGKPQPTPAELEVIRLWVRGGGAERTVDARALPAEVLAAPAVAKAPPKDDGDGWGASPATTPATATSTNAAPMPKTAPSHGGCGSCTTTARDDRDARWLATLGSSALALAWLARRRRR